MKSLGLGFLLLTLLVGTINTSYAQFQVNQKIQFKTLKKPSKKLKDLCKYSIREENKLNDKDNDVDWEFDDSDCSILAVPPKAKPNTVVVQCSIDARVTFLFGDYKTYIYKTKRPCLFPDISNKDIELKK